MRLVKGIQDASSDRYSGSGALKGAGELPTVMLRRGLGMLTMASAVQKTRR